MSRIKLYEIVENHLDSNEDDVAVLVAASSPLEAMEFAKSLGHDSPWAVFEFGICTLLCKSPFLVRGPYECVGINRGWVNHISSD